MSVKTFLKGDKNHLLILPEIGGPVQIVAQCSDWTEGPVRLEGSIQSWGQGCYTPGATLSGPSLAG